MVEIGALGIDRGAGLWQSLRTAGRFSFGKLGWESATAAEAAAAGLWQQCSAAEASAAAIGGQVEVE